MGTSLLDVLQPSARNQGDRIFGIVIGIVTNNQDPGKLGRVKVKFPWLSEEDESNWARVLTPMAGNNRGIYFLPEVDDEVLVAFGHGDMRFPYVLGALWNGEDTPPEGVDEDNNIRVIKSRSGHVIRLDDKQGDEKIEIVDKSEKNKIVISAKENTITISAEADISIKSNSGKLKLEGSGIEIESQAEVKIKAGAALELKGSSVKIDAGGSLDLKSSGIANLKGSMVKIN